MGIRPKKCNLRCTNELCELKSISQVKANNESACTTKLNWLKVKFEKDSLVVNIWLLILKKLGDCIKSTTVPEPTEVNKKISQDIKNT